MRDNRDEHETDVNDHADAYFLLDDGEARFESCEVCRRIICTCDDWGLEPDHLRSRRPSPRRVV